MASIEQLQTALINADKAGDTTAATALATALKQAKAAGTPPPTAAAQPTGAAMDAAQGYQGGPETGWRGGGGNAVAGLPMQPPPQQAAPPKPNTGGVMGQGLSGVNEGIANAVGFPVDAVNSALNGALGWTGYKGSDAPVGGSQFIKNAMSTGDTFIKPAGDDPTEAFARTVGQGVGNMAVMGPATGVGILPTLATGLASGLGEATAGSLTGDNPWAMAAGGAAGGLAGGGLAAGVDKWLANKAAARPVPSVDQLKARASGKYGEANAIGVAADRADTKSLADGMRQIATDKNVISPTGRVASSYPKITDALNTIDDYATHGTMTASQMQAVRDTLSEAAGQPGKEGFYGNLMLKQFDEWSSALAPQINEGNALYATAMRGQEIEKAIELARVNAGGPGGIDKALETQFKVLERQVINGQLKGLSEDEIAAIKEVAHGGGLRSAARWAGKLVPSSPYAAGFGMGAPFIAGTLGSGGNAFIGSAAAGGAAALGFGGRAVANSMAERAANTASLIARSGGSLSPRATVEIRKVAAALEAAQLANATARSQ